MSVAGATQSTTELEDEIERGLMDMLSGDDVDKRRSASAFLENDWKTRSKHLNALKWWTLKTNATVIYDSTTDEFTRDGLFYKVFGKPNVAIIGFTTDGYVFGGFYSRAVTDLQDPYSRDPNILALSFESRGRCATPQKFAVIERLKWRMVVRFVKDDSGAFVQFGDNNSWFSLGNEKSKLRCKDLSRAFEGLGDWTLSGKNRGRYKMLFHHCTRVLAVHLS